MKKRRLTLIFSLISLMYASAYAAPVVMLQFGSFETKEEAETRLAAVKSKHAGIIGTLDSSIREVTLPPDNLTVYRTQAGPIATRTQAQAICSQLASNGDECYVVETAMLPPATSSAVASAAPAPTPPDTPPLPVAGSMDNLPPAVMPARDARNMAALGAVNASPTPPASTDMSPAAPSPELQAAMDRAVAEQQAGAEGMTPLPTPAAPQPEPKRGFWSHLNPFSSSKPVPASTPAMPPPAPFAAAIEPVSAEPVAPASMPAPAPVAMDAPIMTQPEPMRLPPPPAPLMAQAPTPMPAPIQTGTITPPVVAPVPAPFQSQAGNGSVKVEEARRVPLTELQAPPPVASVPGPALAPISLHPNSTLGQKTLWAQLGQFNDTQSALAFWDSYRQAHPDFPVVRVRVTTPYMLQQRGIDKTWLRVGPFAREGFIRNLCASMPENGPRCGVITDMGIASGARRPGFLPGSRYSR